MTDLWTPDPPTKAGFYWWQDLFGAVTVVKIYRARDGLIQIVGDTAKPIQEYGICKWWPVPIKQPPAKEKTRSSETGGATPMTDFPNNMTKLIARLRQVTCGEISCDDCNEDRENAANALGWLQTEIDDLRAALLPFAEVAKSVELVRIGALPADAFLSLGVSVSAWRRAVELTGGE